jgi:hemerythrin-like domain-containing protein
MADKMLRRMLEPRGFRVAQQMEAAREMNLSHDDLRALARRFPRRYDDLLVALGVSRVQDR